MPRMRTAYVLAFLVLVTILLVVGTLRNYNSVMRTLLYPFVTSKGSTIAESNHFRGVSESIGHNGTGSIVKKMFQHPWDRSAFSSKTYVPPPAAKVNTRGNPMHVTDQLMTSLSIPLCDWSTLDADSVKDFVFVIGASANHFKESKDAIGGVQKHMPGYRTYYYDLGLEEYQIKLIKTFCHVTYRRFDYTKYPRHVGKLTTYAFKPVIIHEMLAEHRAVVWMDASFRLLKNFTSVYPQILETDGFLQFWHSPHSNYAVTDRRMYAYLPTIVERQKRVRSRAAGAVYWHRSETVYKGIFYWWVLCALDSDCIAPHRAKLTCRFKDEAHSKVFAGCHRFDMSALNILASNLYGYDHDVYTDRDQGVVKIVKTATRMYEVETC